MSISFFPFYSAGFILRNIGYKRTIILGLLLYVLGALCFYPAAMNQAYGGFVGSLFTIASGLSMLENCKLIAHAYAPHCESKLTYNHFAQVQTLI